MGGTGTASLTHPTTGYYNPATLAWAEGATFSFAHEEWVSDITSIDSRLVLGKPFDTDSTSSNWRLGGVIGYTAEDWEVEERTVFQPEGTGTILNIRDYYLTSAVAAAWQDGRESLGIGASVKYLDLHNGDASTWLIDFGVVAAMDFAVNESAIRPRLGFSTNNHSSGLDFDQAHYEFDDLMRVGLGVDLATARTVHAGRDVAAVSASVDADYVGRDRLTSYWAFGWELSVLELIQFRAGYQMFEGDYTTTSLGAGLGWEFGRWMLRADYAHQEVPTPSFFDEDLDRDVFGGSVGREF